MINRNYFLWFGKFDLPSGFRCNIKRFNMVPWKFRKYSVIGNNKYILIQSNYVVWTFEDQLYLKFLFIFIKNFLIQSSFFRSDKKALIFKVTLISKLAQILKLVQIGPNFKIGSYFQATWRFFWCFIIFCGRNLSNRPI